MSLIQIIRDRQALSWAVYDWANSVFTLVVITGFLPVIYREYWAVGQTSEQVTFQLAAANSLASVVIILCAPILGAYADLRGARKRLLGLFAWQGILMTFALAWVAQGNWMLAWILFFLGSVAFLASNVMYDALLVNVSRASTIDLVSALGYALGYVGSGLLFVFCYWMYLQPERFGLDSSIAAIQWSFILVAIWWAIFSLPVLWFVGEDAGLAPDKPNPVRSSVEEVLRTIKTIGAHRNVLLFLGAYFLYIDGIDTIIRMAIDYGQALNFDTGSLLKALLMTQFIAFPATLIFGWLGVRLGARKMLLVGIGVYLIVVFWGSLIRTEREFYGIAVLIGLVQGGVQSLSRVVYARLIPAHRAAEFFGFYNLMGKSAVFLGPLVMGGITLLTGSHRAGLASLAIFFVGGAILLMWVDIPEREIRTND